MPAAEFVQSTASSWTSKQHVSFESVFFLKKSFMLNEIPELTK
jgi:hypothetical protein